MANDPRQQTVQRLARQLRRIERGSQQHSSRAGKVHDRNRAISTGLAPLDVLLPEGGVRPGSLIECLAEGRGSGAGTLIFFMAANMTQRGQARQKHKAADSGLASRRQRQLSGIDELQTQSSKNLVIIDSQREFYPPAASHLGVDLGRTVVVHPASDEDALWALEQSLRCPGVGVVIGFAGELDDRVFRRLQLAAEIGGGVGLLYRSDRFRAQPSWADIRLRVSSRPVSLATAFYRRLQIKLLRCRSQTFGSDFRVENSSNSPSFRSHAGTKGWPRDSRKSRGIGKGEGAFIELEIDDETGRVRLVTELASPEDSRRANRA